MVLAFFLCISSVAAMEDNVTEINNQRSAVNDESISSSLMNDDSNVDLLQVDESSPNVGDDGSILCSASLDKESSDDSLNRSVYIVNQRNFKMYFNDNTLKPEYGDGIIVFDGNFNNMSTIKFYTENTWITSRHALFNNTVFDLGASGIVLSNINMVLNQEFKDNNQAGIYIHADDVSIYNCTLDYDTPEDVTAFGIYCDGHKNEYDNLKIINNTINFKGHALDMNTYNYPIFLRNTHNSLVYSNNVSCELPIKYIMYSFSGAYGSVSMDTVAAFASDYCNNLTLSNNYIYCNVTSGDKFYPTLDSVILYGGSALVEKNTIICEDYYTQTGNDNYLQGLDLQRLDEVTVINNNISVFTTGGKSGMGTAYPIQINGPIHYARIAFNRLTTYNHGPNLGIYSQNYYGDTYIDIISNFINVTGDASNQGTNPSWCLVSGIEVQDTNDNILNNTIIVTNLGDYKSNANVYGISYVQNTGGGHSYNIQFNNITTNGNYGVKLIGKVKNSETKDSTIANNVINTQTTSKGKGASTNKQVDGPSGTVIKNNTNGRPKNVMSEDYYPDWLKDYLDNDNDRQKGTDFSWINNALNHKTETRNGFGDNDGNGAGHWNFDGNSNGIGLGATKSRVSGRGNNSDSILVKGGSNPQATAPGVSSVMMAGSSSASPSDSGSSPADNKAYEITKQVEELNDAGDYIKASIICLVALLLLIVGYKRQKDKDAEKKY